MTAAVEQSRAEATPARSVVKTWLPILAFSLLWVDLVRLLSSNWEAREQYAYGWFVPFLAVALLWRRWMDRPTPQPSTLNFPLAALVVLFCLMLLPLRVIFEINADWPLIAWAYTSIAVGLTLYTFHVAGGWGWSRHFAFPICFFLVALVWPYRIEKGLTQNLMQVVASLTVEIIGWLGVPALRQGNLIEVNSGVVGVDEACSGIRSFQSTLMGALFLGELYRLNWVRRLSLLAGGIILSFSFNVVRTLFLTWQASAHGIAAIDKWHDSAGLSIFLISFGCLWAVAVLIKGRLRVMDCDDRPGKCLTKTVNQQVARQLALIIGCWVILILFVTEIWYRTHEVKNAGSFQWTVDIPSSSEAFKEIELPERTRALIASDSGGGWTWNDKQGAQWTVFYFRWNPTSIASVLRARIHRPERCLPASGLRQVADAGLATFTAAGFHLPFRQYTYEAEGKVMHVFFCEWEDGNKPQTGMSSSNQEGRLRSVLVGRRTLGQQTLEVIVTGTSTLDEAAQKLREQLPALVRAETPTDRTQFGSEL